MDHANIEMIVYSIARLAQSVEQQGIISGEKTFYSTGLI